MTDPKRWLEDAELSHSPEVQVLHAGRALPAPAGLTERAWSDFALHAGLPGSSVTDGAPPVHDAALGATSQTGLGAVIAKSFAVGMLLAGVGVGGVQLSSGERATHRESGTAATERRPVASTHTSTAIGNEVRMVEGEHAIVERRLVAASSSTSSTGARSAPRSTQPDRTAEASPLEEGARSEQGARSPTPAHATHSDAATGAFPMPEPLTNTDATRPAPISDSELKAEALDLARARNLLASGNADEAQALLTASAARFKNGVLGAEREWLLVQALAAAGHSSDARSRASRFIARSPDSSIAARMRRWLMNE